MTSASGMSCRVATFRVQGCHDDDCWVQDRVQGMAVPVFAAVVFSTTMMISTIGIMGIDLPQVLAASFRSLSVVRGLIV